MLIIELHRKQKPFAVIESYEITGRLYSILFQDRYMRCNEMTKYEIRWFCDNRNLFQVTHKTKDGRIYEYKKFKKRMGNALRHNFLVRNQIIKDKYI